MKFYVNETFYFCASFRSDQNCHKWDEDSQQWIDTGSGPTTRHNTGAIVTFPDGRVALMTGRSGEDLHPYNSLMQLNETWTNLVSFDVPIGDVGGCPISDSELITVGGVLSYKSPKIQTSQAWLFNIDNNTKIALSNMTYERQSIMDLILIDLLCSFGSWAQDLSFRLRILELTQDKMTLWKNSNFH